MNWFRSNWGSSSSKAGGDERLDFYARFIINRQSDDPVNTSDHCLRSLCSCVDHVTKTCDSRFRDLVSQLRFSGEVRYEDFSSLADELLVSISWERIITLFSFSVILSQVLMERGANEHNIHKMLGSYLREKVQPWIQQNGGWEKFCREYGEETQSEVNWTCIFLAGLGLGVGAGLIAKYKLIR